MTHEIKVIQPKKVSIKDDPILSEAWLQEVIANDPSVLGLGDLVLKDRERMQPKAGRLDLLFQDQDTNKRYEFEIQLGKTDESHIIRTIEYNVPIKLDKISDNLSEPDIIKDRKLSGRKVHITWPKGDNLQQNSKLELYWNSLRKKNSLAS